jgi:hypothetical protein
MSESVSYGKNKGYATAEVSKKNRDALDLWFNDAKKTKI